MDRPSDVSPMLTKDDVAERLRLSVKSIERFIASGALPVHRIGKCVRISADDYRAFVANHRKSEIGNDG